MRIAFAALLFAVFPFASIVSSAELAMGIRVGEVTQESAIIWTRLTRDAKRKDGGYREPKKREPRSAENTATKIKVADREGEIVGAPGQIRLRYAVGSLSDAEDYKTTEWASVKPDHDFVHQFYLSNLKPDTPYAVVAEVRDGPNSSPKKPKYGSAEFRTPATPNKWQDVRFTVVTGQSYWDLDDKDGYHIYPAMQALKPHFIVPTGDTVYLDSEAPRARTMELARYHWHRMYSLPRHVIFHQHVPGYWEVDDHDSWVNDGWPTMSAPWMNPLTFKQGFAIYREQVPMGDHAYRTMRWGKGLQIWMVEGRLYRSPNNMKDGPKKTIWGKEQMAWLKKTVLESDADFKVLISPTPIVGPDRSGKADNHANKAFAWEGNHFRQWTKENKLDNFFVCCGDRHWQYLSIDPKSGLREFSCGPASDQHAGGTPGENPDIQPFHRVKGGFLSVSVTQEDLVPTIAFRHHDVHGKVVNEYKMQARD